MKKRTGVLFLIFVLVLATLQAPTEVFCAGSVSLTVETKEAHPGDTVTLSIKLTSNPGVAMMRLPLEYDTSKLEKVSFSGVALGDGSWSINTNATWISGSEDCFGTGAIVNLKFTVKEGATGFAKVTIGSGYNIGNFNEERLSANITSGGVNISTASPTNTPVPPTNAKMEGIHLVLGGNIGMVFHTSINEEAKDGYMEFTVQGKTVATIPASGCAKDESGYYLFQCDLTSVQMSEPVTATYHWGENRSIKATYSIEDYAAQLLEDSQYSAEAKDAVRALINYGHYAQICLSEVNGWELGVDYKETETCFGTLTATAADLEPFRFAQSGNDPAISRVQFSLILDSETSMRLFLTTKEKPSVTVDGENAVVMQSEDGQYYIRIQDIGAGELGKMHTIVVNGKETYQLSALSYATVVLNKSASASLQNVCKALYEYYTASVAYNDSLK